MFQSTDDRERDNTYSKRENGYYPPFEERDRETHFRRENTSYYNERRERDDRERDYGYRQKRDWDLPRDYRPHDLPSPKRRKVGHEGYYENRNFSYNRGMSRSPSPPKLGMMKDIRLSMLDKERYGREYYDSREPFPKNYSYGERERESEHRFYREPNYSRGPRNVPWDRNAPSTNMNSSNYKYEYGRYYDNGGYRKDSNYEDYNRSRPRVYQRDYDRERYNDRGDYFEKRDPYMRERYDYSKDDARERGEYFRDSRDKYYSPRSPTRDGREVYSPRDRDYSPRDKKEEQEEGQITGTDTSTSAPAPTPQEQQPVEKPQPRRTLGWGQGLMSTIKKVEDQKKDEDSAKSSPALGPVPESKAETSPTDEPKTEQMSEQKSNEVSFPVSEDSNMVEDKMEVEQKEAEREEEQGPVYEFPSLPSKEEVLLSIERLDAEITKTEILIHNLNKPKKPEHRHHKSVHSIREQIYEDNKEKVQQAEEELAKFLSPCLNGAKKPLYKQPKDLDFYQQNIDKNAQIRSQVMKVVLNRRVEAKEKKTALTEEFSKLHSKWKKKVKFMEAQRKKKEVKAQEEPLHIPRRATNLRAQVVRQAFPSTPTTPTGRRGFGDAIRSEAEFEEILYQLKEEDERDMSLKYLGTLAKIPPMILDKHKYPPYVDKNGLVEDPMAAERERKMLNPWTEEEKQIFIRKFTQYPKNFTKISSFLDNKTTNEVIWFYYANKKTLDLKKILLEQQTKRKGLARKNTVSTPTNSNVPRELANLGVPWMSETGRVQRSSVRGVNYAESREEIVVEKEMKPVNNRLPLVDPDCRWNEREKETFIAGLTKYGKDFRAISALMGSKTEFQCQNFYHNNKRKLNFDDILERCGMAKDKRRKSVPQTTTKEDLEKERRTREERRVENTWTEQEKAEFVKCLSEFGKNWRKIAQNIPTKSQNQIKYYFQVSKDKLNLDQYLDPEERGDIAKKRGRKKSEDKGPRKHQKLEKDDSDSSAVLSPVPGESPFVDERSNSPFIESTVGSAILSGSLKEDQDVKAVEITQIEEVKERIAKVNEAITSATKIESQEEIDIGNSEVPIENPIPMEISKIDQANEFQTEMVEAVSQEAETKDVAFEESLVPHRTIVEDENLEPMIQQKVIEHNEALENTPQTEESRTIEVPPQELAIPLEENRLKVEKADSIQQEPVPSPINPSEMTANQDLDQTVVNNDTTLETIPQVNHPSDLVEQTNLLQNDERLKTEAKNTEEKLVETGQQPSEMEANVAETEDKIERTEEMIEKTAENPPVEETSIEKEEEIEERSMEPQGAELDEQLEKNEEQPPRAIEEQLFEEPTEQRLPETSEDVASYNNFQTSIPYEESTTDIASNVKPEETIVDQEEAPIPTLEEVNSNEQPKEEYGESEPVQYEETYYQEQHQEVAEEYVAENQEPQEYYGVQLATLEDGEISEGYAPNAEQEETVKTSNEASGENIEAHYELPSEDMGASEGTAIVFDPEQVSAFKALESEQFWGTSTDSNQGWQGEENMDIEPS